MGDKLDAIKLALFALWLVSFLLTLVAFGGIFFGLFPQETTYQYEVKAQQVFDTDRVEDSDVTQFENLSDDEQYVLYKAFKKSDHFMGTSQVTVSTDEPYDTFTDWRTVESNGVLLLVAINEDTSKDLDPSQYVWYHHLLMFAMLYCTAGIIVFILIPTGY